MNHEYDFEENLISERVPLIKVPQFKPLMPIRNQLQPLNNETLKNIELYLLENKTKEDQRIKQMKARQQFIGEQVSKQIANKESKLRAIEEAQKQKSLKECTFKPNIKSDGAKRNLSQFLEKQNEFAKKVEQKKSDLKKTIEMEKEKASYRPKINESKSRKVTVPVHERLYSLKNKENVSTHNYLEEMHFENTFKPKISQKSRKMARNGPVQDLLYGDALRRQQKSRDIVYTQNTEASRVSSKATSSLNNEKFAAQKFIREYFGVLETLGINLSVHHHVDYIMFNEVLKAMKFIQQDQESEDHISVSERALVHDAYSIVEKFGANARNICVFLLGLIGIYHINPINFEQGEQSVPEKEFNLDEGDGRKMQRHFDSLFRNRLGSEHKSSSVAESDFCSFQPKINKNSEGMAEKHRAQMLEEANQLLENYPELEFSIPEDGIISHTDLLVLSKMAKDIELQKKRENGEVKGLEECTFKPSTLSSMQQTMKNSKISTVDNKMGEKKSFELYNYHKNLQNKKESLQASRQMDLSECTFAPNLKKEKVNTSLPYAKNIDEAVYRIQKGRQLQEERKEFLKRGQKPTHKMGSSRNQSQRNTSRVIAKSNKSFGESEEEIPTLILDVNLGDRTDRINIYKGDEHHLQEVADKFASKHDLDQESKEKLLELLEVELENVLDKIEEDEECEDFNNE